MKKSTTGYNRDTFLKFDLGASSSVSNAKLRLFGGLSDAIASSVELAVHSADSPWSESTLNWSNRPLVDATPLATTVVAGTTAKWCEIDLTAYLKTRVASGSGEVTLVLRSKTATSTLCQFNSDEATSSQPQLVIMT